MQTVAARFQGLYLEFVKFVAYNSARAWRDRMGKDEYKDYALDTYTFIMLLGTVAVFCLLALGLSVLWPAVWLMAAYIGLGLFAHGFHVSSILQCSVMSIGVMLGGTLLAANTKLPMSALSLILAGSLVILASRAPQISKHSFVPPVVRKRHRKVLLSLAFAYAAISLISMTWGYVLVSNILWVSLAIQALGQTNTAFRLFDGDAPASIEPEGITDTPRWVIPKKKMLMAFILVVPIVLMVGKLTVYACFEPWAWHTPGISESRKAKIEARVARHKK